MIMQRIQCRWQVLRLHTEVDMTTIQDALNAYNQQHGTNYATVQALSTALTTVALREAWIHKKINDAHEAAANDVIQ
jgi:uncharacterized protein